MAVMWEGNVTRGIVLETMHCNGERRKTTMKKKGREGLWKKNMREIDIVMVLVFGLE